MAKKERKTKSPILLEFAKKVRIRRYELGLTQEQLAEKAGFHVNFIGVRWSQTSRQKIA